MVYVTIWERWVLGIEWDTNSMLFYLLDFYADMV
jgi:hypothetical protein